MGSNNNFQNLWTFDLVAMLALLFMAVILLRAEVTKTTTMPVVTSLAIEDSSNFSTITDQINILYDRLIQDPEKKVMYDDFTNDRKKLEISFANPNYLAAQHDATLDIFNRLDTLIYTRKTVSKLIDELVMIRDSLFYHYIRETRIERKVISEEELMFPVDEAKPWEIHPTTKRHLNQIMGNIYASVDTFIMKGYNIVKVIGYTDPTHSAEYNRKLSLNRAQYLADKIQKYIDSKYGSERPYIVQAAGYGEFSLLKRRSGETIEDWWQRCRRVELLFSFQRF